MHIKPKGNFFKPLFNCTSTMAVTKIYIILILSASVYSSPVSSDIEETTDFEDDPFGYVQDTVAEFIDSFLEQDNFQVNPYTKSRLFY